MAWEDIVYESLRDPNCTGKITLKSTNGWSGRVVRYGYDVSADDRKFYFKIDGTESGTPWGTFRTYTDGNCTAGTADFANAIMGISLQHMGIVRGVNFDTLQFRGDDINFGFLPAWGARSNDSELTLQSDCFSCDLITVVDENQSETEYTDVNYNNVQWIPQEYLNYMQLQINGYHFDVEIDTDLPIFETDADLLAYCQSGGTDRSKILNIGEEFDPEEEYLLDQKFYFIHNSFTHYYHGTRTKYWRNYRFKPGYDSKIRLYRVEPNDSRYYTMVLIVPGGMTRFIAPEGDYNESSFVVDEDTLQTHYCEYSFQISRVAPRDEMVVTSPLKTNIPIFGSREDATKYANDELSIEDALNYSDILAFENQLPQPDFGEEDAETETGINGQTYAAGSAVYVLTKSEMIRFFSEIFKIQDPSFINAFKDGNVLFGDNQANAIIGCMYFPFDASIVCSLESSSGSIWVGGWQSQNATGRKVNMNDKVISIGEFFLPDMFKDFRDYEPYTNIYVQLPYCGTYQLSVQKYLNKTVKINYAVDIFTGACTALIYANNILMDSMDGMIGSQRPVTGRTAANMLQAITRGSASVAAGAAGGLKMGGIAASIGGELSGAYLPAFGASVGGGAMFSSAHAVALGTALTAGGAGLLGAGAAAAGAVAGVDMMYKAKNAYADPPMATRGQYSGNLGMFGNQKVHFIVAIRHNYRPENELDLIGYPSGRGGKIGSFSGFLKSSSVYLADGFIGSVQERNEILQMIAKGIYI